MAISTAFLKFPIIISHPVKYEERAALFSWCPWAVRMDSLDWEIRRRSGIVWPAPRQSRGAY